MELSDYQTSGSIRRRGRTSFYKRDRSASLRTVGWVEGTNGGSAMPTLAESLFVM